MQDRPLQQNQDTIRVPLYGEEKFIPDSLTGYDMEQQFINCYPEITTDPTSGEKQVRIVKRPGNTSIMSIKTAVGASSAADVHVKCNIPITQLIDVFVVAAFDSARNKTYIVQYRPVAGTATLIGDLGTTAWSDPVHITEYQQVNSGTLYPAVAICWKKADESVSRCYSARSDGTVFTGSSLAQITVTGFPDQQTPAKVCTGPFQQMNGLVYIMCTDGTIANSGGTAGTPNDITSTGMWNTLSVILTYQSPDRAIGIYRYKHHLLAVGKDSIEFFNDIGNPPPASSLERTEQAYIKFGAPSSKAVINVADTLYWLAYGSNNTLGLWKMEGYSPVKVSRSRQDTILTNGFHQSVNANNVDLFSMMINGKLNIGINNCFSYTMVWRQNTTFGDQTNDYWKTLQTKYRGVAGTLIYNATDDLWWAWSCSGDYTAAIRPATIYPTTAGSGSSDRAFQYTQYFFYDANPIYVSAETVGISPDYVLKLSEGDQYNFVGMVDKNPNGTDRAICMSCQLNTLDFGTQKRKRINKLNLVFDHVPNVASGDTNAYSISLIYRKGNYTSDVTQNIERYISYPNSTRRYYFNNLGMGRVWSFCITSMSVDSFTLKGIELDVEQESH